MVFVAGLCFTLFATSTVCIEQSVEKREREKRAKDAKQVVFCPIVQPTTVLWVWVCMGVRGSGLGTLAGMLQTPSTSAALHPFLSNF